MYKLRETVSKFYHRHSELVFNYNVCLNLFCSKAYQSQYFMVICLLIPKNRRKVSKGAKIRNRDNQVPHLTQNTNGKVTNSQLGTTNESQEVSPFQACDQKAHINRHTQRHSKHKTEQKHKRSTKEVPPWNGQ